MTIIAASDELISFAKQQALGAGTVSNEIVQQLVARIEAEISNVIMLEELYGAAVEDFNNARDLTIQECAVIADDRFYPDVRDAILALSKAPLTEGHHE